MSHALRQLQFWKGMPWRQNALFVALAGMEMAWLTPFVMAFFGARGQASPLAFFLTLWGIMIVMMMAANYLAARQVDSPLFELAVLAVIVIVGLLVVRLTVFWQTSALDLGWIGQAFLRAGAARTQTHLTLGVVAYLWWRGVTFLQREVSFFIVGYDFRKGLLFLIGATMLYSYLGGRSASLCIFLFFFFSLVAVALGRVEDKSQASGGAGRPFGPRWLTILSICSVTVVFIGGLFGLLWSAAGFRALWAAIAPAGSTVGDFASALLYSVLRLIGPLLDWLINALRGLFESVGVTAENVPNLTENLSPQNQALVTSTLDAGPPAWFVILVRYVIPIVLALIVLIVLVLWLERKRRRRSGAERERSDRASGAEREEAGGLLRAGWARLRRTWDMIGQFGLGRRLYAAISVRNIYANVQHLAAERGAPRHKAQTPLEFLPRLRELFPDQGEALARITLAYVAVEYGEAPTTQADLERLRADWDAIRRAAGEER